MADENDQARSPELKAALVRHAAGAIVTHNGPFTHLQVPANADPLGRDFIEHWIRPLYMSFFNPSSDAAIEALWPEMNCGIAYELLSYFNWRPRVVGGYIVAIKELHELTDLVGKLLLRSDVCFAGKSYCLALAQLNTPESRRFLHEYLEYYLSRSNLWFDQNHAIGAVAYLDRINGTEDLRRFTTKWDSFVQDKPQWNLAQSSLSFSGQMDRLRFLIGKGGPSVSSS